MSKRLILRLLLLCALLTTGLRIFRPVDKPIVAEFVTVQRRNVHKVKAITGRLLYADEAYILAETPGIVSKVCVTAGQRVAANEALIRIQAPYQEQELSVLLSNDVLTDVQAASNLSGLSPLTTVRSAKDATVRQILVEEGTTTVAGTPLLRISSHEQIIRCPVLPIDANGIVTGQWAWIFANGESMGTGVVTTADTVQTNTATGLLESIVTISPAQHINLPEGASIDVEVYLSGSDNVLALPVEAITPRKTVWWVNEGRCTEIPAQIVMNDEMYAWVNLPEGLTVAIGEFTEGQRVMEADREAS